LCANLFDRRETRKHPDEPSPMMLYSGHVAIGEIRDGGPGSVSAIYITATGRRLPLGFHKDRWSAREAIEARHAGGPEPLPREDCFR
jgi:hypothetical protein